MVNFAERRCWSCTATLNRLDRGDVCFACRSEIPFAQFRYEGVVVSLDRDEFASQLRDAMDCRCGKCLACRAGQYWLASTRKTIEDFFYE